MAGALLGCFVFAVDMLLLCSNQQYSELPLTAIYSLWVVRNDPAAFVAYNSLSQEEKDNKKEQ